MAQAPMKLGQMTVGAGVSKNNLTTAVPFNIPTGVDSVILLASGADCYAIVQRGTSALAATSTTGVSIGTSQFQIPCQAQAPSGIYDAPNVLAVFNNNIASRTVDVWAIYA